MALPRKGSRSITVDGVRYRWYVRHKPTYGQQNAWSSFSYAVAHEGARGATLVVHTPHKHPNNWFGHPAVAVCPSDVAHSIQAALAQGWQSVQPGKPFCVRALQVRKES